MRAKPVKCYIGNYDGQRNGMIFATSKREAAKIAGCSVYHFERHWGTHTPWPLPNPKAMTLYTRKSDGFKIDSWWYEGICTLSC